MQKRYHRLCVRITEDMLDEITAEVTTLQEHYPGRRITITEVAVGYIDEGLKRKR